MSLTLETREKQKPIILIYGNNPLVPLLLEEYSKEFKIAYVVELEQTEKRKDFYRIPRANVQFVKNLEEKIDYAVIFLSKKEDKNLIPSFMEKISNDGTRTAVIINVENLEDFYDVLLEYKNISPLKFLFLGDVYSENPSFNIGHKLFKIIQQAISEKSIRISQDFEPIFAIYYRDAILGINQTLFGPKKTDKFYYLFYSEPQSINSLAYILHRVEPDLEIHYQESLPAGRQGFLIVNFKIRLNPMQYIRQRVNALGLRIEKIVKFVCFFWPKKCLIYPQYRIPIIDCKYWFKILRDSYRLFRNCLLNNLKQFMPDIKRRVFRINIP